MAVTNPPPPHVERFERRPGVDIGADGERAVAGSGDDHRANVGIAVDLGQESFQLGQHLRADRIQLGRSVQSQRRDSVLARQHDAPFEWWLAGRHGSSPLCSRSISSRAALRQSAQRVSVGLTPAHVGKTAPEKT